MTLYVSFVARFDGKDRAGRIILDHCSMPDNAAAMRAIEDTCARRIAGELSSSEWTIDPREIACVITFMHEMDS